MGGPVWKRVNVVGPRAVNRMNPAGYGRFGPEESWTVPSLFGKEFAAEGVAVAYITRTISFIYIGSSLQSRV